MSQLGYRCKYVPQSVSASTIKSVTNYKEPPKPKPTTQEAEEPEEGAKPAPAEKKAE